MVEGARRRRWGEAVEGARCRRWWEAVEGARRRCGKVVEEHVNGGGGRWQREHVVGRGNGGCMSLKVGRGGATCTLLCFQDFNLDDKVATSPCNPSTVAVRHLTTSSSSTIFCPCSWTVSSKRMGSAGM